VWPTLSWNKEEIGEMRGKHSRKKFGLIIGEKLGSIRGMDELRFLHKTKVH
jgi:hypothetical protein